MSGLQLPNWIIPVAGFAAAVWAIAIWWMVAALPPADASEAELDLIVARAEIERLQVDVDELSQQVEQLHQERGDLVLRLDALEQTERRHRGAAAVSDPVAGPPPAKQPPEATAPASGGRQPRRRCPLTHAADRDGDTAAHSVRPRTGASR